MTPTANSLSVASASISVLQKPKMSELYPKEFIGATGGEAAMEKLREIPEIERPDYGPNIENHLRDLRGKKVAVLTVDGSEIIRGVDKSGRPFLQVFVKDRSPLVYYTYSNSKP